MKTITFYSYKGGTGRSLATAQLAVILARFGKSVCVVDFDFEAPGLHHKFRSVRRIPDFDKGLVNYINDYIATGKMESLENKLIKLTSGEKGVIHIFPAGNILKPPKEYWRIISNPEWHKFMTSLHTDTVNFLIRLKSMIARDLDPPRQSTP